MMKQKTKDWFRSKTLWINVLVVVGGTATAVAGELATGGTITAIGFLNILMRFITNSKLEL